MDSREIEDVIERLNNEAWLRDSKYCEEYGNPWAWSSDTNSYCILFAENEIWNSENDPREVNIDGEIIEDLYHFLIGEVVGMLCSFFEMVYPEDHVDLHLKPRN